MNEITTKFKETIMSVLPIMVIVLILHLTISPVESFLFYRFLIGSICIIIGLAIFLWGVDLSVTRIGEIMGKNIAHFNSSASVFIFGFILGFAITVAEPDLMILARQISQATAGAINPNLMVAAVSAGVGLMVGYGFLRILRQWQIKNTFLVCYLSLFIMMIFVTADFQALAYDASGATTGAMTTPFILALAVGVSQLKGSAAQHDDSFGLVGLASVGPITAVMLVGLITGLDLSGEATDFMVHEGILNVFLANLKATSIESLMALLPITLIFYVLNAIRYKIPRREVRRITAGLIYALIGLIIFLTGVNSGFMELARVMATDIANGPYMKYLPIIGLVLGMVVVLAEPAVYVLTKQVEDLTGGSITRKLLLVFLSIGVAVAVMLSMLRIMSPALKIWMIIVPGFALALILSRNVDDIFIGIAFDAGGVASGPMTSTFILAFCQGVAASIPTANVVTDGFGVIAQVAMTPVVMILLLGMIYKRREAKNV